MKTVVKRAIRDEKGAVLALALVLLVIGGLILTPLLGLMSTGLLAGQVYEKKTDELYAADAGVEDAIWRIQTNNLTFVNNYSGPWNLTVNGRDVSVEVYREDLDPSTCEYDFVYQILSNAVTDDGGGTAAIASTTTIDAHLSVSYLDLSALLDNAIVSDDTITIQPGNYIDGDVWLPDAEDLEVSPGSEIDGNVKDSNNMTIDWPTYEQLSIYYMADVVGAPDPGPSIDLQYTQTIGPGYREGSLEVDNTGDPATLLLEGTVYVAGDLEFRQSGASKNYTLDLNGQTIFAEGTIGFPSNVVSVAGPGCIIARYDIDFHPSVVGNDFVFVYSIEGQVDFQPSGDFTGCIAGNVHVQLQPGNTISWISPEGKDLNVPWGVGDINDLPPVTGTRIDSWEIE
ncbi:hypothetical protein ACFLXM_00320 [Chloroflexota bacterium]